MMKFLKSNIILIFLIVFFCFIIAIHLIKLMNIYEGIDDTVNSQKMNEAIQAAAPALQQAAQVSSPGMQQAIQAATPGIKQAIKDATPALLQAVQAATPALQEATKK
jgi:predicted PurR-regulated permease PerM